MIKQNIKIAIITIISFLTFWLVMFNFIKVDKASQGVLYYKESSYVMVIDKETSAYIEKHEIDKIAVEFNKQYFDCFVRNTGEETEEQEYQTYFIVVPKEVYSSQTSLLTNIIVDRQNLYQHWFKK